MSRIAEAFADGPAFIPYVAAGDPDFEASQRYVEALVDGGADVVELGLPFSDPVADGATIQGAVRRALDAGMTPERYFEFVDTLDVDVPLVCMTYYNLLYQYGEGQGPEAFVERAAAAGIDGFVIPDLPAEEAGPLRDACDRHDRDLIFIVAPTTRGERLERMMEQVSGYVYVQARLGTSGARDDVSGQTAESLARLADYDVPKAVGFGISEREHAREIVAAGADGIIVGSALVDIIADGVENDRSVEAVAADLEAKARELVAGASAGHDLAKPEGT
ncbi:MAG: tryptophan synthase subunit alpha [Halobacteriaceae archaeon]